MRSTISTGSASEILPAARRALAVMLLAVAPFFLRVSETGR